MEYNRDDNIDKFMSWFTDNGGIANNVKIHRFDNEGYGLIATNDIKVSHLLG